MVVPLADVLYILDSERLRLLSSIAATKEHNGKWEHIPEFYRWCYMLDDYREVTLLEQVNTLEKRIRGIVGKTSVLPLKEEKV